MTTALTSLMLSNVPIVDELLSKSFVQNLAELLLDIISSAEDILDANNR